MRERDYLKSNLAHHGVPVPVLHRIARRVGKGLSRHELTHVVQQLWDEPQDRPVYERRFLAADVTADRVDVLVPADLALVERLCREARTWAIIDTLAPRVVGPLAERYPAEVGPVLDSWSRDDDFWMRRCALLAHLIPLRQGRGDWTRFTRYADDLLDDREFFVAKAIGWVLRDTGRTRPDLVLGWIEPRITRLQSVSVREALKPLPEDDQQRLRAIRSPAHKD